MIRSCTRSMRAARVDDCLVALLPPGGLRFTLATEEPVRSFDPARRAQQRASDHRLRFDANRLDQVDRLYQGGSRAGASGYSGSRRERNRPVRVTRLSQPDAPCRC
jgi:hypothetical protein